MIRKTLLPEKKLQLHRTSYFKKMFQTQFFHRLYQIIDKAVCDAGQEIVNNLKDDQ